MTKKTLKLDKEQAIELYNKSNDPSFKELLEDTFGKDFVKPKEIYDKVFDLKSLSDHLGYNPLIYPSPNNKFEEYINSCSILAKVAKVYNEGIILNWKNTNEYKYLPYIYFSGGSLVVCTSGGWCSHCDASGLLYYKSKLLSEKSYNNFKLYWENYWQVK